MKITKYIIGLGIMAGGGIKFAILYRSVGNGV